MNELNEQEKKQLDAGGLKEKTSVEDFFLYNIYFPTKRNIENIFYWIRTHTINKYHIIDCRDKKNGYAWGWCDRCDLILFSSFNILKDFMEKEYPGIVDWDYDQQHKNIKQELQELYSWWTLTRPINIRDTCSLYQDDEDQKMLERLMKIRQYMWT